MNPTTLLLLGVGLWFLLKGSGGGGASGRVAGFYDASGQPISTIRCGQAIGFDVPGYDAVWLIQTKDGRPQFNGRFPVPMSNQYPLNCGTDVGVYVTVAYSLNAAGTGPADLLLQTGLTVTA